MTEQHHHDRLRSNGDEPLGLEASLDPSLLDPRSPSKRTRSKGHATSNGRGTHLTTWTRSDLPSRREKQTPPSTSRGPSVESQRRASSPRRLSRPCGQTGTRPAQPQDRARRRLRLRQGSEAGSDSKLPLPTPGPRLLGARPPSYGTPSRYLAVLRAGWAPKGSHEASLTTTPAALQQVDTRPTSAVPSLENAGFGQLAGTGAQSDSKLPNRAPGSALRKHKAHECGAQPSKTGRSLRTRSGQEGDWASPAATSVSTAFGHKALEQRAPSPANAGVPVRQKGQRHLTREASSSDQRTPPPFAGTRPTKGGAQPGMHRRLLTTRRAPKIRLEQAP